MKLTIKWVLRNATFLQRKTNKERVSDQKWNEIRVLVRDLTGQVPEKVFSGVAIQLQAFKAILNLQMT